MIFALDYGNTSGIQYFYNSQCGSFTSDNTAMGNTCKEIGGSIFYAVFVAIVSNSLSQLLLKLTRVT